MRDKRSNDRYVNKKVDRVQEEKNMRLYIFFLLFIIIIALTADRCQGLECFLDLNATQFKHLPRSAHCQCDLDQDLETFSPVTDLAQQFDFDLISALHSILFIECEQLHLNLSISDAVIQEPPFPLQEVRFNSFHSFNNEC